MANFGECAKCEIPLILRVCKIGFLLSSFFYEVFIANSSIMHMSCWCEIAAAAVSLPYANDEPYFTFLQRFVARWIAFQPSIAKVINYDHQQAKNHLIILPFSKSLFKNYAREKWPIFKTYAKGQLLLNFLKRGRWRLAQNLIGCCWFSSVWKLVKQKTWEKIKSHLNFNFWPARQFLYFYDIALFLLSSHLTRGEKYNKHFWNNVWKCIGSLRWRFVSSCKGSDRKMAAVQYLMTFWCFFFPCQSVSVSFLRFLNGI